MSDKDSQKTWEKFSTELDAYGRTVYALDKEEKVEVQILPDKSVSPAKFKAHPFIQGAYIARPLTIRAMKKDLFLLGDDIVFTEVLCLSCSQVLEKECWNLCPYCGEIVKPEEV